MHLTTSIHWRGRRQTSRLAVLSITLLVADAGKLVALAAHTPSRSHVRCAVLLNSQDLTAKDRELSYDASTAAFILHPLFIFSVPALPWLGAVNEGTNEGD